MQPAARGGLTADQVTAIIRDSSTVDFSAGLELLDMNLNVLEDISDDLRDGSVSRSSYATLHGTATLSLTRLLDWGTALVRPYMILNNGTLSARFNLGAYLTSSPVTNLIDNPITHEINGFDILHWLNTPVGESYVVAAGAGYLSTVTDILLSTGIVRYVLDQTATASVLPTAKVWALDDNVTWLTIINDLLAAVGYQGIWSDWDGLLRIQAYETPQDRAAEWLYSATGDSAMITPTRTVTNDVFNAPNRWVFTWAQDPSGVAPVEGAGIYTFVNASTGPTSVEARGRVISASPQRIDVVDQTSLIAAAQQRIDADLRQTTKIDAKTFPNPLHWHMDRMAISDPGIGSLADVLGVSWDLPLNGADMTHEWSVLP